MDPKVLKAPSKQNYQNHAYTSFPYRRAWRVFVWGVV